MNSDFVDKGTLQVRVSADTIASPIQSARVRITDPVSGNVIDELTTNESGLTPVIELPAPPIEYSMQFSLEKPYAVYNLTIGAVDFKTVHIGGVQVLPSSRALQNTNMRRMTPSGFNVVNLSIPPNTLWGDFPPKIPEASVKPLPEAEGFVVLPKPVIPEFVIVHLGTPSDTSAENVWVYFKDYIKNVASSEIYSTWSREAIKANVLAIISFTLNRVFTEWYRGKGFDFTITNSTAYDQSFNYGRNIFEEIAIIVDDLFTTYITKEGILQPLLAQYCDGKRVQCDGLSQWGSQSLGEQGQDAINILRRYYGSDIYLDTAEKVEGVPRSFSGTVLTPGSSGNDVETIQMQLNRISENFPAIKKVKVTSYFDDATQDAVKEFQRIFDLPQTGNVDFATWYRISHIYVSVMQMSQ